MKHRPTSCSASARGSAFITVIFFMAMMALLTASMLTYTVTERRYNERQKLILRARNMAENVALYASEQVTTKLYRLRNMGLRQFAGGTNQVYLPPDPILTTSYSGPSDTEVYAGLTANTSLALVSDPSSPDNGLQVSTGTVQIIAKSTMTHPATGPVTAYAEQDLEVTEVPLFQFAIFYNQDLEFSPGANMVISGPVHANGNLIARDQTGFANTVQFKNRVSASGGFYANTGYKGTTYNEYDNADSGPGGTGPLYFQNSSGIVTNIDSGSIWRDHRYGQSTESATTLNQFKSFATTTYTGNLRTSVHGVTPVVLPGVDASAPNSGRSIIEVPSTGDSAGVTQTKFSRNAGLYIAVNPDANNRTGILPDATTVSMPPYSYRCWLNTINSDGSHTLFEVVLPGQPSYGANNATQNNLPNRFTDLTAVGINQILRIPASGRSTDQYVGGTGSPNVPPTGVNYVLGAQATGYTTGTPSMAAFTDAYFYDLRRATNSTGHPFNRPTSPFTPRPVSKIDFDMTRFRLMVERALNGAVLSSSVYWPNFPTAPVVSTATANWPTVTNQWNAFVFNPGAAPAAYRLGVNLGTLTDFSGFPVNGGPTVGGVAPTFTADPFKMYFVTANPATDTPVPVPGTSLYNSSAPSPWFSGIAIYVDSVGAEIKDGTRADSGVRLWNGRGPNISLSSTTGLTGLSFATNDAVYIVGHYNADGTINATSTDITNPGGYSAVYPDSNNEFLNAVMGDALTILSQPVFTNNAGTFYQSSGWSDSLSAYCRSNPSSSPYSTSWQTTNPNFGNSMDGVNTGYTPAAMPNRGNTTSGSGSSRTYKFSPTVTEVSAALLAGIVPTDSHQTSGGAHNFPRLLEAWSGTGLYIRGSMVAMFASVVATEPWSIRVYSGAGRYWGLHAALTSPTHHVPLEPILLSAARLHYNELTATQFATIKTAIQALP